MATSTLTISCACQQIGGQLSVPTALLPLPIDFCHCQTCRHITGQLANSKFVAPRPSPGGPSSLQFTSGQLTSYKSSDHLTRYFCGHCGASIYNHDSDTGNENVATGAVEEAEGKLTFKQHMFVAETTDGGLSTWLHGPSWSARPEQSEEFRLPTKQRELVASPADILKCYCHCRGVEFEITRPNEESSNVSSPFSDLIAPFHSHSPQNKSDAKWWLRANGTKYFAGLCACNSCRKSSGYDLQAWCFVSKVNIRQIDGKELDYDMGMLKQYCHSQGAYRNFCQRCGATVFWNDDERPGVVDVSVGLLNAEEGARSEDWLEWATARVSFEEFASNKTLVSSVSRGLKG